MRESRIVAASFDGAFGRPQNVYSVHKSPAVVFLRRSPLPRRRPCSSAKAFSKVWQLLLNHACFKSPPSFNSSHKTPSLLFFFWTKIGGGGGEKKGVEKRQKKNSKRRRRRRHDEDGRRCDYHHLLLLLLLLPSFDDWRARPRRPRVISRAEKERRRRFFAERIGQSTTKASSSVWI